MATTFLVPLNNAESKLDGAVNNAVTSWTVLSAAAFPGTYPFHITCENEIVSCTSKAGNVLTVVRARESTAAAAHATGSLVQLRVTAKAVSDLNTAVNALEAAPPAHHDSHDPEDGSDALDCAAPSELAGVQAAGEGSAHEFARADHAHQIQHSIADNHLVTIDGATNADEYARFTASGIVGRTEAEFKGDFNLEIGTDVLAQQTIGIADDNLVEIDHAAVADDDYAKFTANGLEGRSYAETLADISPLTTRGDIMFRNATVSTRLAAGAVGEVLTMGADDPSWAAAAGGTLDAAYDAGATITVDDAGTDLIFNLTESADFIIKDNGTALFTFSDTGALTHNAPAQLATSLTLTQAGNYTTNANLTLIAMDRTAVIAAGGDTRFYYGFNIPTLSVTHPINASGNRTLYAMYFTPTLINDITGGGAFNVYASYVYGMEFIATNDGDNAQTQSFATGRYARGLSCTGKIHTVDITGGDTKNRFFAYGIEALAQTSWTETNGTVEVAEIYGIKGVAYGDSTLAGNVSVSFGVYGQGYNADINYSGYFYNNHVNASGTVIMGLQDSLTGACPVLHLDQDDISEEFIRFTGSAAAGVLTQSIVDEGDQASETREGWLKVYVVDEGNQTTDQAYYVPIYTLSA